MASFRPTQYNDAYFFHYLNRKPKEPQMATYYLQYGLTNDRPDTPSEVDIEGPRFFIDSFLHRLTYPCAQVEATTWLEARDHPDIEGYSPTHYGVFTNDTRLFLKLLKEYHAAQV
jgi:hypothetical protein